MPIDESYLAAPEKQKPRIFIENVRFNGEKMTENLLKVASGLIIIW